MGVSIVLVTNTQNVRYIPRVHSQQVVQLVNGQLVHFVSFPVHSTHIRECQILLLDILCHIGIGQDFKDIARLVTVVNPVLVSLHGIPNRVILHLIHFPANSIPASTLRQHNRRGTFTDIAQIENHVHDTVFNRVQAFIRGESVFVDSLVFIGKNQLIKSVGRIGIRVCPAGILTILQEALVRRHEPATLEVARTVLFIRRLARIHIRVTNHVIGILLFASCIKERHRSKSHVIYEFVITVISGARPFGSFLIVRESFSLGKFLTELIHFSSNL